MSDREGWSQRARRLGIHAVRVLLFGTIIVFIHLSHAQRLAHEQAQPLAPVELDKVLPFFPTASSLTDVGQGRQNILDSEGDLLGYTLQTSPDSDHLLGFSGPTDTLIAFDEDDQIIGIDIISSKDTREHVAEVLRDNAFLESFRGLTRDSIRDAEIDAVSGATLTSLAIQASVIHRLGGPKPEASLRFPEPLVIEQVRPVFESAAHIVPDDQLGPLWHVTDEHGNQLGSILRTSPAADNLIGYQGPTEGLICFDVSGRVVGIVIGQSYDNDPFVTYVREDEYFLTLFNSLSVEELAELNLEDAEVEGVSGATMTSMAVADGLIVAAQQHRQARESVQQAAEPLLKWTLRDFGTGVVIATGLVIAMTSLRGKRFVRLAFQAVLIVYLGLINGDLVSQAMIVGWAQVGIPWANAGGLVLLTTAAFLTPITTGRNVYCSHLCPHGAAQQLLKNRLGWRWKLSQNLTRTLQLIPAVLLTWCLIVAMFALPFSLVDIEPFDAWVFQVAGWATITIAIVGLGASLFVPMAYCRFGCPTGALLGFLRFHSRSDQWSRRDWFVLMLTVLAAGIWLANTDVYRMYFG